MNHIRFSVYPLSSIFDEVVIVKLFQDEQCIDDIRVDLDHGIVEISSKKIGENKTNWTAILERVGYRVEEML